MTTERSKRKRKTPPPPAPPPPLLEELQQVARTLEELKQRLLSEHVQEQPSAESVPIVPAPAPHDKRPPTPRARRSAMQGLEPKEAPARPRKRSSLAVGTSQPDQARFILETTTKPVNVAKITKVTRLPEKQLNATLDRLEEEGRIVKLQTLVGNRPPVYITAVGDQEGRRPDIWSTPQMLNADMDAALERVLRSGLWLDWPTLLRAVDVKESRLSGVSIKFYDNGLIEKLNVPGRKRVRMYHWLDEPSQEHFPRRQRPRPKYEKEVRERATVKAKDEDLPILTDAEIAKFAEYDWDEDDYIAEKAAAAYLGIGLERLRAWRDFKKGPPFLKASGLVRYFLPEVRAWKRKWDRERGKK